MAITKSRDKRTGIIYVYESESYWDKELKAPRNRKKLIGKLDEETGQVIPTGKRGRKPKEDTGTGGSDYRKLYETAQESIKKKDEEIISLKEELAKIKKEYRQSEQILEKIRTLLA